VDISRNDRKRSGVDIIWIERRKEVEEVIDAMVMVDGRTSRPTDKESFALRTTACKTVYDRLTTEEKIAIKLQIEERQRKMNIPEEIQQK
jgi:hypothetical protein